MRTAAPRGRPAGASGAPPFSGPPRWFWDSGAWWRRRFRPLPFEEWIGSGWVLAVELFRGAQGEPAPALEPPTAEAPAQTPEPAGVRLEVTGGELLVRLADVAPGTELDVRLTDGFQAAVFAPQPAGFRTSEGRIEVIGGSGRVRVDLPRSVRAASIEVNGRISVRKVGDRLDATGSVVRRGDGEVRLRVP